jgi:FkbM family methyltransferase
MTFQVLYGMGDYFIDVTRKVIMKCYINKVISLPASDNERAKLLGDPMCGTVKEVVIIEKFENETSEKKTTFPVGIVINYPYNLKIEVLPLNPKNWKNKTFTSIDQRIQYIHGELDVIGGSMSSEYHEQRLVAEFIFSKAKVLEIGSNIGRNTLMIASHLDDDSQLVTLECSSSSVEILKVNRDTNNFKFHIEPSALSARKLYQVGWDTYIEETRPSHAVEVSTITWEKLQAKYSIEFDTLVADCEGALYYILTDTPELLTNIKLIIVENDYHDLSHKLYVESLYLKHGFKIINRVAGGWGPCYDCFYEVWSK